MGRTSDAKERLINVATCLIWEQNYSSVSVDKICKGAGVNKGSFYHFFTSKEALAIEAVDHNWQAAKERLFGPAFKKDVPPLERFNRFFKGFYRVQSEMKEKCGCVAGCPFGNLGSEVGLEDTALRKKVQEIFAELRGFYEEALCDALEQGFVKDIDPPVVAKTLGAFSSGLLLQAKVFDDVEVLRLLSLGMARLIGVEEKDGRLVTSVCCKGPGSEASE
ncbi:hypothetical protein MNBD_DELTA01-470 [hydrothermal vent metagenome]|uniref:HTH tetR-type domain-containing protein n=1 Tax=hydrothermal vent metagenome TaxID=652676 RepID=A0A3B0QUS7_9ZZZZ